MSVKEQRVDGCPTCQRLRARPTCCKVYSSHRETGSGEKQ